ncbi:MAG: NYN domain-containing protein [Micropepsaceae bacterium]
MAQTSLRLAVLIDADNVSADLADALFRKVSEHGEPTIRRAYGALGGADLGGWREALKAHAITPLPHLRVSSGKNGADIALAIDAMEFLQLRNVDAFCIVSSDNDFSRLAARIRERGSIVFGFGDDRVTPEARRFFSKFFDLSATPSDPRLAWVLKHYSEVSNGDSRVLLSHFGKALKAAGPPFEYKRLSKLLDELGAFDRNEQYVSLKSPPARRRSA